MPANLHTIRAKLEQVHQVEKALEEAKQALIDECQAARDEGHSYVNIAKAAGISVLTLRRRLGITKP